MAIVATSCSKDDDDVANTDLVGTWVSEGSMYDDDYRLLLIFKSDGTGSFTAYEENEEVESESFTWSATKETITVTYDFDPKHPETQPYKISSNGKVLTINEITYHRQ